MSQNTTPFPWIEGTYTITKNTYSEAELLQEIRLRDEKITEITNQCRIERIAKERAKICIDEMKGELKAKYLFDTFKKVTNVEFQEYAGARYTIAQLGNDKVKELVNVTIDEVLRECTDVKYKYWQEVKDAVKLI